MPTDYILFVHGVNNRDPNGFNATAQAMRDRIAKLAPDRTLKAITFFWGDLNVPAEKALEQAFVQSDTWSKFWFRNFRSQEVLGFVGDAALYLSRAISSSIVSRLYDTFRHQLSAVKPGDRLHFVTHSWGTVLLFDILFASRWDDQRSLDPTVWQQVQEIRQVLFGLPPTPNFGIPIASIHTMGSPIALFNLLNYNGSTGYDLTSNLKEFLQNLYHLWDKPLSWQNYAHPGDPIGYPLEAALAPTLNSSSQFVVINDVISPTNPLIGMLFGQTLLPLLWGGDNHGSYWNTPLVDQTIATIIKQTPGGMNPPKPPAVAPIP